MIIDKAEATVTSPDRSFVALKLTTDEGRTGPGDATFDGRELAVASADMARDDINGKAAGIRVHRERGCKAMPLAIGEILNADGAGHGW